MVECVRESMKKPDGKTALVTRASRGMGRAIVFDLAHGGVR